MVSIKYIKKVKAKSSKDDLECASSLLNLRGQPAKPTQHQPTKLSRRKPKPSQRRTCLSGHWRQTQPAKLFELCALHQSSRHQPKQIWPAWRAKPIQPLADCMYSKNDELIAVEALKLMQYVVMPHPICDKLFSYDEKPAAEDENSVKPKTIW